MTIKTMHLHEHEVPGKRLGRHVRHDPRSWGFPAPMAGEIASTRHERMVPIFDQGSLGSCCGNAAVGCVSTAPYGRRGDEAEAVAIYSEATHLDRVRGIYPPDDTGSSGLAVMKAMKNRGWIAGYSHAFGLDHVLRALVLRPGICGLAWREGMDEPDKNGKVAYAGAVRGGHEVEMVGLDANAHLVWFANSWGEGWGLAGFFSMSWADLKRALADHGDATFALVS